MRIYPDPEKLAESDFQRITRQRHRLLMILLRTTIQASLLNAKETPE